MNLGYFQTVLAPGRWYRQNEFLPARTIVDKDVPPWMKPVRYSLYQQEYSQALYELIKLGIAERRLRTAKTYEYQLTTAGLLVYKKYGGKT